MAPGSDILKGGRGWTKQPEGGKGKSSLNHVRQLSNPGPVTNQSNGQSINPMISPTAHLLRWDASPRREMSVAILPMPAKVDMSFEENARRISMPLRNVIEWRKYVNMALKHVKYHQPPTFSLDLYWPGSCEKL